MQTHISPRWSNQPLIAVKRKLWRMDDSHVDESDRVFAELREKALMAANHTCVFCGFRSPKFQEIHHKDDNHANNSADNLLCCCTLCHLVHHVGMLALKDGAFIAMVPELTQTEINHLCRAYFVLSTDNPDSNETKKMASFYSLFEDRADRLKSLHPKASNIIIFADILSHMPDEQYDNRKTLFTDLRIIPKSQAFHPHQLDYYVRSKFVDKEKWKSLFDFFYSATQSD